MRILALNVGSSSVKADLLQMPAADRLLELHLDHANTSTPVLRLQGTEETLQARDYTDAMNQAIGRLLANPAAARVDAVVHRVAHGGDRYSEAVLVDADVLAAIQAFVPLAPLHNPPALEGIRVLQQRLPQAQHVAVFDTAFHQTLPARAYHYALPQSVTGPLGIRRHGFHGTSHAYVARKAAEFLQTDLRQLRLITCHLGNGASACAVEYGRSIDTSMGFSPLEGLVMGTRPGDLDPGLLSYLLTAGGYSPEQLSDLLNRESGLLGLAGTPDMRQIERRAADADPQATPEQVDAARLALHVFTHRLRKYIGAYAAVMGGVDAIVFTAGIGENSGVVRQRAAQRLEFLGAILDEEANRKRLPPEGVLDIGAPHGRCRLLVVHTDEQRAMAEEAFRLLQTSNVTPARPIPIAISARHVHLRQETVEALFGPGYQLRPRNPLRQPGQWAAEETVTLVGPKRRLEHVRILGPVRKYDQVEISRSDEFFLGVDAPVRESGNIAGTPGILIETAGGNRVKLEKGVICAWRHIHMSPDDAEHFGVHDKDIVEVAVQHPERPVVFGNVLIRVSPDYVLEMHVDTDEGNAAEIGAGTDTGVLHPAGVDAQLIRKKA